MDPDIFQVKTDATSAENWIFEKMQAVMSVDQFVFALMASMECQVCMLYNPGDVATNENGWCVTIGKEHELAHYWNTKDT